MQTYVNGTLHGLSQVWLSWGRKWHEVTYIDGKRHGISYGDYYTHGDEPFCCYEHGKKVSLDAYAKMRCALFKEELAAVVHHPDRLDRLAKTYGMDTADYMDLLD